MTESDAWPLALRYGSMNGLDPALIMAVIRQESDFDESATNPEKGGQMSRGLMQVEWPTAQQVARSLGLSLSSPSDLFTPDTNIALGARYLADQTRKYGLEAGISAYNAGHPIAGNAGYVANVLTYFSHYQSQEALPVLYPSDSGATVGATAGGSGTDWPTMIGLGLVAAAVGVLALI